MGGVRRGEHYLPSTAVGERNISPKSVYEKKNAEGAGPLTNEKFKGLEIQGNIISRGRMQLRLGLR